MKTTQITADSKASVTPEDDDLGGYRVDIDGETVARFREGSIGALAHADLMIEHRRQAAELVGLREVVGKLPKWAYSLDMAVDEIATDYPQNNALENIGAIADDLREEVELARKERDAQAEVPYGERLECSVCPWTGCEADATRHDVDDDTDGWACPECSEPCAHLPLDEETQRTATEMEGDDV